jgi:DNA-binding transcriptional MerR regulator
MGFHTRGEVVRETGLTADTIRYYERIGLVPPIERSAAGRRRYTDVDLQWLGLVGCLRDAGMPIAEVRAFTTLMRDGSATESERLAVLRVHEQRINEQVDRLAGHLRQIHAKIDLYTAGETWSPPRDERRTVESLTG